VRVFRSSGVLSYVTASISLEAQQTERKFKCPSQNKKNIMKTQTKLYLLAVSAAAFSLSVATSLAQPFSAADARNNRAIAASPRAKEVFPWLTRDTAKPVVTVKSSDSRTALTEVTKNRALAASPRALEQFPELGRPVQPLRKSTERSIASMELKNRAYAASPRAIEQFPWLARGAAKPVEKTFQIAPVK
jgi:hypothetical protein